MPRFLFLLMAVLLFSFEIANSKTLFVAQSGEGADGASWDTAFKTVTTAILSATEGDQIWVKEGVYIESIQLTPKISLYGGFAGTEVENEFSQRSWRNYETILSGPSISQYATGPIVVGGDQSLVDGFTIQYGIGGVYCEDVSMELRNCRIQRNAALEGGGVTARRSNLIIENCHIVRNQGITGVGIFLMQSGARITNCLFYGQNTGIPENPTIGGTIYMQQSEVSIEHCTLEPNIGVINNTGVVVLSSECHVINSIVRGSNYGTVDATYSDILGVTGEGNIDIDPGFRAPFTLNPDSHLRADSPCIDAATGSTLTLDLDGNPRPVDVPGIPNNPTAFDMGCYEYQLPKSDLNGDGKVDAEDLLMFQKEWMWESDGVDSQE